jgi:4-hydroxythreonine-4-phosphate dehydrogenase
VKPILAITLGDFNGVGPEVALKSVLFPSVQKICTPVLVGSLDVFEWYAHHLRMKIALKEVDGVTTSFAPGIVPVVNLNKYHVPAIQPGTLSKQAGRFAGEAIIAAAKLCLQKKVDGLVTAPVSKEAMRLAGFNFPGQTEILAKLSGSKHVRMMLIAEKFRVGLASVHIPLKDVAGTLSKSKLLDTFSIFHNSLKKDFLIRAPKIAVLGLNPHAGEHGMIGTEERRHILPAIRSAIRKKIRVEGPFPADGFFATHSYNNYDAVIAMYHDQGLIPLKMKGFEIGVNYSAGLSIVRTSPDHGTAFDIAGKRAANPASMIEAIKLAVSIIRNRKQSS